LLGTCEHPIVRSGALPGDRVWLSGPVGLARAGLMALESKSDDARLRPAIAAWLRPFARIEQGRCMSLAGVRAAIDVSDGLAQDVGHVAQASGVSIVLDEGLLRAHAGDALAHAAAALGVDAIDLALHGGEDYALVATGPSPIPGFVEVGRVIEGSGVILASAEGTRPLEAKGFDHFRP
jgi:thiamine-monophosphate kinase